MKTKYKAVFYDWDGCIAKTIDTWLEAYRHVLSEEGILVSDKQIITLFGNWEAPQILGHPNLNEATTKVLNFVHERINDVEAYDLSIDTIKKLKSEGVKVAILTSSKCRTVQKSTTFKKLKLYIDLLLCAEDVNDHKPHPEIIQLGLSELNLKPEEILMIGDSDKDLGAANSAGVDSVLYAPTYNRRFHDHDQLCDEFKPTYVFNKHDEILQII